MDKNPLEEPPPWQPNFDLVAEVPIRIMRDVGETVNKDCLEAIKETRDIVESVIRKRLMDGKDDDQRHGILWVSDKIDVRIQEPKIAEYEGRAFPGILFLGSGERSVRGIAALKSRLDEAISALCGLQQGGDDPDHKWQNFVDTVAKDFAMALTGKNFTMPQIDEKNKQYDTWSPMLFEITQVWPICKDLGGCAFSLKHGKATIMIDGDTLSINDAVLYDSLLGTGLASPAKATKILDGNLNDEAARFILK